MEERIAVTIGATDKYQYAMIPQARAIHANLHRLKCPIDIILVGDEGLKKIAEFYEHLFALKDNVIVHRIAGFKAVEGENYQNAAQLLIAQMRTAAFTKARSLGATYCWSFDSDVIPKSAQCYATLRWLLDIPGDYYEVAIAPYPSQGGGDFLAGRGSPENPIIPDFKPEERQVPEILKARSLVNEDKLKKTPPGFPPAEEDVMESQAIRKEIEGCAPAGNVFECNAKFGWRRRGWLSNAYPALGRGTVVPSDWCGFGCTLLNARALDECDFTGYEGAGTEDLFICFNRWHQAGIRIGAALHEPAFHISRRKGDERYFASTVRFVTEDDESKGECVGHLRIIHRPYYAHVPGEKFEKDNDGCPMTKADREAALKAAEAGKAPAPLPLGSPVANSPAGPAPPATVPKLPATHRRRKPTAKRKGKK